MVVQLFRPMAAQRYSGWATPSAVTNAKMKCAQRFVSPAEHMCRYVANQNAENVSGSRVTPRKSKARHWSPGPKPRALIIRVGSSHSSLLNR